MEALVRREGEEKKSFYRRLAKMRKDKWAGQYRHREDHYKFHFMVREEEDKTKPISKSQPRCEQRIRNRMAAQESRERHRCYVQELQRKAKIYDQLVANQQLVCKHCRQNLACDLSESEEGLHSASDRDNSTKVKEEPLMESYLTDEVIRIDNDGITTPFGIFFAVCLIAVLAISSLHSPAGPPRLLAANSATQPLFQAPQGTLRNFAEYIKSQGNLPAGVAEVCVGERVVSARKNLRSYTVPQVGWRRVGEYICSAPEEKSLKQDLETTHAVDRAEQVRDNQEESSRLRNRDWQRVEVSQCFRSIP